jgi:hypothetical protein
VGYVESYFDLCGDRVKIGARFAPKVPQDHKSFWAHLIELLSDVGHVESPFSPFRDNVSIGAR